jgi:hypothetical protein
MRSDLRQEGSQYSDGWIQVSSLLVHQHKNEVFCEVLAAVQRASGSWELDGNIALEDAAKDVRVI